MRNVVAVIVSVIFIFSAATSAQQDFPLPVCSDTYMDADGDGFGWTGSESCRITDESRPAPSFINQQTGNAVALVRAYWDPNKDIGGRLLRCEQFDFSTATGEYQKASSLANNSSGADVSDVVFFHEWLARLEGEQSDAIYSNWNTYYPRSVSALAEGVSVELLVQDESVFDANFDLPGVQAVVPLWSVEDGIYKAESSRNIHPLLLSPYVEIVDFEGGFGNAVNVWAPSSEGDMYFRCHALDLQPFIPTGQPCVPGTRLETLDDDVIVSFGNPQEPQTMLTNLESGEPVVYTDLLWNYNRTIAGQSVYCQDHVFGFINAGQYDPYYFDLSIYATRYIFIPTMAVTASW